VKLRQIAERLDCGLHGDPDLDITGVAGIETAGPDQLTFISNPRYARLARTTRAGAIVVDEDFTELSTSTLRTANPYLTFARAIELFYQAPLPERRIHATAQIAPTARIGPDSSIGAFAVIEDDVEIGPHATIGPFTYLGSGTRIGASFRTHSHASVRENCLLGDNVILQEGARVGSDGYGYAKQDDGSYYKIVQSGVVVIEDDVEIGANATVDRPSMGETRIRRGVKIDSLVQVGHACDVGENTLLCAQVGLAGSSRIGRDCILTGQVGVAGHLTIGDRVIATAQSGIPSDVPADSMVSGYPAIDSKAWRRSVAIFKRLSEFVKRIEALEKSRNA
jgi:UDP-3-O-[3-hydroxymyristoyl] glucosamine N-acyltransferase